MTAEHEIDSPTVQSVYSHLMRHAYIGPIVTTGIVRRALAMAAMAWVSTAAHAQIYSNAASDSDALVLSNFASSETSLVVVAAPEPTASITALARSPVADAAPTTNPPRPILNVGRLIDAAAKKASVSAALLHAVVSVESNYDPAALSPKGAIGLMQLLPATARRFGVSDPYAVEENLRAGASYLRWLLDLFDGDVGLALAGYNAGEQAVIKAGHRIPPFAETQAYVPRVLGRLAQSEHKPR